MRTRISQSPALSLLGHGRVGLCLPLLQLPVEHKEPVVAVGDALQVLDDIADDILFLHLLGDKPLEEGVGAVVAYFVAEIDKVVDLGCRNPWQRRKLENQRIKVIEPQA